MTLFDIMDAAPVADSQVKAEKKRLHAANLRVLELLKARGARGATNWELCAPEVGGIEAGRRTRELRAWGYEITRTHESGGTWRYVYTGIRTP